MWQLLVLPINWIYFPASTVIVVSIFIGSLLSPLTHVRVVLRVHCSTRERLPSVASCPNRAAAVLEAILQCAVSKTIGTQRCDVAVGQTNKQWEERERVHQKHYKLPIWSPTLFQLYVASERQRIDAGGKPRKQVAKDHRLAQRSATARRKRVSNSAGRPAKPTRNATAAPRSGGPASPESQRLPLFSRDDVRTIPDAWVSGAVSTSTSTFDDAAQVQARVQRIAAAVQATVDALTSVAWDRLSIEVAVWMTADQRQQWRCFPHVLMRTFCRPTVFLRCICGVMCWYIGTR